MACVCLPNLRYLIIILCVYKLMPYYSECVKFVQGERYAASEVSIDVSVGLKMLHGSDIGFIILQSHKYNNLQFFERDKTFWAPASTTSGLYEQLCTKRYREISRDQIR